MASTGVEAITLLGISKYIRYVCTHFFLRLQNLQISLWE